MAEQEQKTNYLELFDVSKNSVVGTAPLDEVKHMPRVGERIFLPAKPLNSWTAYTVVRIEYFLSTNEAPIDKPGALRVTLYAEPSK